jgi:branched-chain amino acid aminotransferase
LLFLHKNNLADIQEHEIIAFESQKAEEILMISDEKGIFSVGKIRNKTFEISRFLEWWKAGKKVFKIKLTNPVNNKVPKSFTGFYSE